MSSHFGLSIRLLDRTFHGRRDGGAPEWPPSPLRAFQALVAAAAARERAADTWAPTTSAALRWLEGLTPPTLVAPTSAISSGYRLSVPNNAMDIVAQAWSRGNDSNSGDANPATHRTMKTIHPTWLLGGDAVHYLWPLSDGSTDEVRGYLRTLCDVAQSVVALGWGVDMAVGHGAIISDEQAHALPGERWLPSDGAPGDGLRVPRPGTLVALIERHEKFSNRLGPDCFTAPPPLSGYRTVAYHRATEPAAPPIAAFSLLKLDASGFRPFDAARRALTIAGMLRHAAKLAASRAGWTELLINTFILGHGEKRDAAEHVPVGPRRFAYLPLPSIEARGPGRVATSIRRVIVTALTADCEAESSWVRRALSGQELIDEDSGQPVALLALLPGTDPIVQDYTRPAASWATVTPVVLPGYDDRRRYRRRLLDGTGEEEQKRLFQHLGDRIEGLLRKAIRQAGYSQVLADHADLDWSHIGFWPGVDLASRYGVPDRLRYRPRFHVRVHWRDVHGDSVRVPGPVCIGSGRFTGLGLFAGLPAGPMP